MLECLYDILEVPRDCSAEDIKKAYKKVALKWHPDKNRGNEEEAEKRFKEIQRAYTVLSDPQERDWYDKHRESILSGGDGTRDDDDSVGVGLNLFPYFSATCFTSFVDSDEKNFFSVFASVFETLNQEEISDGGRQSKAPSFGRSTSSWDTVGAFYAYWGDFVSEREFGSADKFHLPSAPSRLHKRFMEKENKRERDKFRKERNEQVRALVQWVKKRDPRVAARKQWQLGRDKAREAEETRLKAERAQLHAERKQEWKAERTRQMQEEDQAIKEGRMQRPDAWLDSHPTEKNKDDDDDDDVANVLYCAACGKSFKSQMQWSNHEKSKKHIQRVQELRDLLLSEDGIVAEALHATNVATATATTTTTETTTATQDSNDHADDASASIANKALKKKNNSNEVVIDEIDADDNIDNDDSNNNDDDNNKDNAAGASSKKSQKKKKKKQKQNTFGGEHLDDVDAHHTETVDELISRLISNQSLSGKGKSESATSSNKPNQDADNKNDSDASGDKEGGASKGKEEKKRRRRRKDKTAVAGDGDTVVEQPVASGEATEFKCNKCRETFSSKTKLFKHLQDTGHASVRL